MYFWLVGGFLVIMALYHVIHTFFGFWLELVPPSVISGLKDVVWISVVMICLLGNYKNIWPFFRDWKRAIVLLGILVVWSLGISFGEGMSRWSIIVWFKYDIYPLVVVLSAIAIWSISISRRELERSLAYLPTICGSILLLGLVRQWGKMLVPDLFVWRGYGPIGDYVLGMSPPIWYRTWPWGMMRLQGIFAWPNNFGFFLVGIGGLITYWVLSQTRDWKKICLAVIYAVCLAWTLSRGAWIGAWVAGALTVRHFFPAYKKWLICAMVLGAGAVGYISLLKAWSTSGHWTALVEWLHAFAVQPRWYGLGMAWPSIHYAGVYLPENQYMQILLDLWLPWLVLWCSIFGLVGWQAWKVLAGRADASAHILVVVLFGLIGLCVEGMFLHVREDSMVNYLLLVPRGVWVGVLMQQRA